MRPCSRTFSILVRASCNEDWINVLLVEDMLLVNDEGGVEVRELLGVTTSCTTFEERPVQFVKVVFNKRQVSWNNHALTSIQILGSARPGDVHCAR